MTIQEKAAGVLANPQAAELSKQNEDTTTSSKFNMEEGGSSSNATPHSYRTPPFLVYRHDKLELALKRQFGVSITENEVAEAACNLFGFFQLLSKIDADAAAGQQTNDATKVKGAS